MGQSGSPHPLDPGAVNRLLTPGAYAITEDEARPGTVWHHHLPEGREIGVYPLLFGEGRVFTGFIEYDNWNRAYDYRTVEEAVEAAKGWINTSKPPPGEFIRKIIKR